MEHIFVQLFFPPRRFVSFCDIPFHFRAQKWDVCIWKENYKNISDKVQFELPIKCYRQNRVFNVGFTCRWEEIALSSKVDYQITRLGTFSVSQKIFFSSTFCFSPGDVSKLCVQNIFCIQFLSPKAMEWNYKDVK